MGEISDPTTNTDIIEACLRTKIAARIKRSGPLSVMDFMQTCLFDPELGYYKTQAPLGQEGDFITAPETSQIFGELIGLWAADIWQNWQQPENFILCELGPGRGTLMSDALRAVDRIHDFKSTFSLHLVETNPVLRDQQKQVLNSAQQKMSNPISWHDTVATLPGGPMVVIANEFLDALPIRQFQKSEGSWFERMVTLNEASGEASDEDSFCFCLEHDPQDSDVLEEFFDPVYLRSAKDGAIIEMRPMERELLSYFATRAQRHSLAVLIIDYGHEESGYGDTLQAVKSHRFADPLEAPGDQDLTAHVDFAGLKRKAQRAGLAGYGPIPQGAFLTQLGLGVRLEQLMRTATQAQKPMLVSGVQRLVDPQQMGVLFKVLALLSPNLQRPLPFDIENA